MEIQNIALERAKKNVERLKKLNQLYLSEMAERGKELEQLYTLFRGWKSQMPEALTEKVQPIFDRYMQRCTVEKTAKQMRHAG